MSINTLHQGDDDDDDNNNNNNNIIISLLIFLRETMSLGNTVLKLFCCFYSWCLYH